MNVNRYLDRFIVYFLEQLFKMNDKTKDPTE